MKRRKKKSVHSKESNCKTTIFIYLCAGNKIRVLRNYPLFIRFAQHRTVLCTHIHCTVYVLFDVSQFRCTLFWALRIFFAQGNTVSEHMRSKRMANEWKGNTECCCWMRGECLVYNISAMCPLFEFEWNMAIGIDSLIWSICLCVSVCWTTRNFFSIFLSASWLLCDRNWLWPTSGQRGNVLMDGWRMKEKAMRERENERQGTAEWTWTWILVKARCVSVAAFLTTARLSAAQTIELPTTKKESMTCWAQATNFEFYSQRNAKRERDLQRAIMKVFELMIRWSWMNYAQSMPVDWLRGRDRWLTSVSVVI